MNNQPINPNRIIEHIIDMYGNHYQPRNEPMPPYTCSWWLEPGCLIPATHLILIACEQGHIRERLLCGHHHTTTLDFINNQLINCTECNGHYTHHMTRTPIENHWNLDVAIHDTEAIITTFYQQPAPWATIPPSVKGPSIPPGIPYYDHLAYPSGIKWQPKTNPTQKEINDLKEKLEALKNLSTPTKDPKILSWISKHFPKKP